MAAQQSKNSLASALGVQAKKAWEAHKNDETNFSMGSADLPAGIENGIAQLTEIKFDVHKEGDNKGKWFFYAHGTVLEPTEFTDDDGVTHHVEGRVTKIIESLYDTPSKKRKTLDEHIDWVMNELRKLGLDTSELSFEDLEAAAATLKDAGPTFKFRTWSGAPTKEYPNPIVNHQWGGAVEYEATEESGVEEEEEKPAKKAATTQKAKAAVKKSTALDPTAADGGDEDAQTAIAEACEKAGIDPNDYATWQEAYDALQQPEEPEAEEEVAEEAEEEEDWKKTEEYKLGVKADKGDEKAIESLTESCARFDIDPDEYETWVDAALALMDAQEQNAEKYEEGEASDFPYEGLGELADSGDEDAQTKLTEGCEPAGIDPNDYATWAEVEELLKTYHNENSGSGEAVVPEKGEVYMWKPPKGKKEVECEVIAVDKTKEMVSLKDLTTKMVHKGVPFSAIV